MVPSEEGFVTLWQSGMPVKQMHGVLGDEDRMGTSYDELLHEGQHTSQALLQLICCGD